MKNRNLPKRYTPTDDLESGGFGSVVKCLDTHLDRYVAIKSINDAHDSARMRDELSALMRLRSKHVVEVFDAIEYEDGTISIVEEFINGPSLHEINDSINDVNYLIKILWQISSGIAEIHDCEIIHRDIKPGNMKIDHEGVVKIYDFGLSRNVDNAHTLGFKGTPIFAAPELFMQHVRFTKAVDTYAFAVTAMYLAKTKPPVELSYYPKQLNSNPFDSSEIQLPDFIKGLLYSCLDVDPKKRPAMQVVRDGLKNILLSNSHRALLITDYKKPVVLSETHRTEFYDNPGIGSIEITYSGSVFFISKLSGDVYVNNIRAKQFNILPNSCVIILGPAGKTKTKRVFITFDLSHPEVVL
ncbi:protein kinase [Klebsiella variicola]|uniref:serine/threonine-protein kinase n=1 Tax=Klebsiella variicola TaxID=244366 RepID=UPI002181C877|nr:serine/threonine-protein kinase [Klebsiella variicola]GKK94964.1 protein kinase [Klebsiella variicola]HCI8718953.1 serine/threonine protein kinase [Klebsiella variicola]